MKEYKIITDDATTCQKLLNQWKHEFRLDIIAMQSSDTDGAVRILLTREKLTTMEEKVCGNCEFFDGNHNCCNLPGVSGVSMFPTNRACTSWGINERF